MKLKLFFLALLILIFAALAFTFINQQKQVSVETPTTNPAVTKSCEQLVAEFIEARGYEKSGLLSKYDYSFSPTINSCLLSVRLETKWKNGDKQLNYMYDFFDLTNQLTLATFRGQAADPEEAPQVSDCKIFGNSTYDCYGLQDYMTFVQKMISLK